MSIDSKKLEFIKASIAEIRFFGITDEMLKSTSKIVFGEDKELYYNLVFYSGLSDFVVALESYFDELMYNSISAEIANGGNLKLSQIVKKATSYRIYSVEHKSIYKKLARYYSNIKHIDVLKKILWNTSDTIWRLAGDTSTDWNFYSKRAILSLIYSATMLVYLNESDNSFVKSSSLDIEADISKRCSKECFGDVFHFGKMLNSKKLMDTMFDFVQKTAKFKKKFFIF